MENLLFIVIIILLVILIWKANKIDTIYENFDDKSFSIEALNSLVSVYANKDETVSFNNVKITGNLIVDTSFNMIPRGCIIAYNSVTAPAGWVLCDGTNGTPDLRGRFVRMWYDLSGTDTIYGDELDINIKKNKDLTLEGWSRDAGDKNKTKMRTHSFGDYGGTDFRKQDRTELPEHQHAVHGGFLRFGTGGGRGDTGGGGSMILASETHGIKDNGGSTNAFGIQPPYYVLTYIMKT